MQNNNKWNFRYILSVFNIIDTVKKKTAVLIGLIG